MDFKTLLYILKRTALAVLTVWVVITVTFFVMRAVPGGPFAGEKALDPESLAALGDTLYIGEVDLSKLNIEMNQTFDIVLPAGVTNRTMVGLEHKAKVTISFPDLKAATYTITNIVPANVAQGLRFELVTKQFSITLRGPKALIDALDASQIVATVDASDAKIGELHGVKPVVKLPEGFEAVGMISVDNVQIMFKLVEDSGR